MKPEFNTDIDILLRKAGKAWRRLNSGAAQEGRSSESIHSHQNHLDADAMNAFVEGALPSATRARYADHLADCSNCRGLLTKLALTSTPKVNLSYDRRELGSRLWENARLALGAFFTPRVLSYAAPALVLMAIIGVVLIATRGRHEEMQVARNEETKVISSSGAAADRPADANSTASKSVPTLNSNQPNGFGNGVARNGSAGETRRGYNSTSDSLKKENPVSGDAPGAGSALGTSTEAGAAVPKEGKAKSPESDAKRERDTELADRRDRVTSAPEPPPNASNNAPSGNAVNDQEDQARDDPSSNNRAGNAKAGSASGEVYRTEKRAMSSPSQTASMGAASGGARRASKARTSASEEPDDRTTPAAVPTNAARRISGHTFKREGTVWIDSAYNSSLPLMNVRRGSEQYRALVADEPAIQTIAQRLAGEVVLVWKGQAYDIR